MTKKVILHNSSNKSYDHLLQAKFCSPSQLFYVNMNANEFFNNILEAQNKKLDISKNRENFIYHDVKDILVDDLYNFLEAISMLDIEQRYPNILIREGNTNLDAEEYELFYTYHIFDNMLNSQGKFRVNPLIIPILGENIYLKAEYDRAYIS